MTMRRLYDTHDTDTGMDLRGWSLKDEEGRVVGQIEDLLVDAEAGKIRYAVAAMPRRILLPVGLLHLEEKDRTVTARGYSRALLGTLTEYEEGEFTGAREERHYVETVQPDHRDFRDVMQDTSLQTPTRDMASREGTAVPVNYEHDRFQVRNQRMQEIEDRYRALESRRRNRPVDTTRETTFQAAEPTREELHARPTEEVVEIERKPEPRKTIIDLRPLE